jgi:hypothetical protein
MKKRPKKRKKENSPVTRKPGRKLDMYGDKIRIPDDFNAPLPDEILDAFEGKAEEGGKPDQY